MRYRARKDGMRLAFEVDAAGVWSEVLGSGTVRALRGGDPRSRLEAAGWAFTQDGPSDAQAPAGAANGVRVDPSTVVGPPAAPTDVDKNRPGRVSELH